MRNVKHDIVLARIDAARLALEKAHTFQEVKQVYALADAARIYGKHVGASVEVINHASEIQLRAKRKLGDLVAKAPKNKGAKGKAGPGRGKRGSKMAPRFDEPPTLAAAGISKKTSAEAQKLASVPEPLFEAALSEAKASGEFFPNRVAAKIIRESKRSTIKTHLEEVAATQPQTPTGKFDVLVIDPPWPMAKIERDERANQSELDYPVMSLDEIKGLQIVADFAKRDTHVFLWATQKFLPAAFVIFEHWGVRYLFTMVWHKPGGFQPVNLPQFNCEFCLYGRIGNPEFIDTKAFPLCFQAPRGKHSEKPEEFYALLRRVTAGRRYDSHNRRKIDGFIGGGNEAPQCTSIS